MDVNVALATELPAVTDLKLVGGEVKRIGSIMSQLIEYYADLEWKNPANLEELGFVRNDVAFVGMGLSDTKLEGAAESAVSADYGRRNAGVCHHNIQVWQGLL